jgi:hypothetical protein
MLPIISISSSQSDKILALDNWCVIIETIKANILELPKTNLLFHVDFSIPKCFGLSWDADMYAASSNHHPL